MIPIAIPADFQVHAALAAANAGFFIWQENGTWMARDPAAQAWINSFDFVGDAKARRLLVLKDHAHQVMQAGHVTSLGPRVDTDPLSLLIFQACSNVAAANSFATFNLPDASGVFHVGVTATQITSVWNGITAFMKACLDNWQTLSAAINSATTVAGVQAVDLTVGWPT